MHCNEDTSSNAGSHDPGMNLALSFATVSRINERPGPRCWNLGNEKLAATLFEWMDTDWTPNDEDLAQSFRFIETENKNREPIHGENRKPTRGAVGNAPVNPS